MNKPNINIKEILGKLSFLKDNLALLVPVIIALVALLLLIPTRILGGRLRSEVEKESVAQSKTISRLMKDLSAAQTGSDREAYITAMTEDANAIEDLMTQTVMRELLRYDLFPDTNETSTLLFERFSQAYRAGVETMVADLKPGVCPTTEDIQEALKSTARTGFGPGGVGGGYDDIMMGGRDMAYGGGAVIDAYGAGGDPYGGGMMGGSRFSQLGPVQKGIVDQVCLDAARASRIYASEMLVGGYRFWNTWKFVDRDTSYRDCWYWQLGYWIVEDVMATIDAMNGSSANVLDSPVKRLMHVNFTLRQVRGGRGGGRSRGPVRFGGNQKKDSNNPSYVTTAQDVLSLPCTGRVTNEEIDVVQFGVRVVVETSQVVPFMQELCSAKEHRFRGFYGEMASAQTYKHNQIGILECSVAAIELQSAPHELYRYGDNPVVELDLICEYVLPKVPAFDELKPKQVVEDIQEKLAAG